jgi:hypothetical protein
LSATTRIAVVELVPGPAQRWELLGAYVELVWVEVLGVTTTAIARRLGHLLSEAAPRRAVSLDALATPLHTTPAKALDALRRLHHHGIIEFHEHSAVIGCSGRVPDVHGSCRRPIAYTTRQRLELEHRATLAVTPERGAGGCRSRRSLGLEV